MRITVILLSALFVSSCANLKLSWDETFKQTSDKKTLNLPQRSEQMQQENEQIALDILQFYSNLLQIPAKERKSQLSLAKARFEASPDIQRRLELVFAHLAVNNKNKNKEVKKLVSEIDSKQMLNQGQHEVYALLELVKMDSKGRVRSPKNKKLEELQSELAEKEVEISKLLEQIDALKNIEQSIHQRELGTITDGK